MPDERFMRHHYGPSGYAEPDGSPLTPFGEKLARVQVMCTEGFCNISIEDKAAIREVWHCLIDRTTRMHQLENLVSDLERERDSAFAANSAEFEGHKLSIAGHRKEMARLNEALSLSINEKRREQAENTRMREALQWYASPRTWNQWCPDSFGERARKALKS